jgi:hypothetical protein
MNENLRTQKCFKLHNIRIKNYKIMKIKKCSPIMLSSKQKEERQVVRKMNLTIMLSIWQNRPSASKFVLLVHVVYIYSAFNFYRH